MRWLMMTLVLVLALSAAVRAQATFVDVPPWHWAFDAVQQGASLGIFEGYPTNDRDQVANAVAQVYEAFAHAGHPAAQGWAERFLINTPAGWPEPLRRSPLVRFTLGEVGVRVAGDQAVATFVAEATVRVNGTTSTIRSPLQLRAQRDEAGHWRIDYASLAAGQPQLFR